MASAHKQQVLIPTDTANFKLIIYFTTLRVIFKFTSTRLINYIAKIALRLPQLWWIPFPFKKADLISWILRGEWNLKTGNKFLCGSIWKQRVWGLLSLFVKAPFGLRFLLGRFYNTETFLISHTPLAYHLHSSNHPISCGDGQVTGQREMASLFLGKG